jgi:Mycoplasma protein of unknown function, DUF285
MSQMFENAKSFVGGGLESFDVSGVISMSRMFAGATSLETNGAIAGWEVGNVEAMDEMVSEACSIPF